MEGRDTALVRRTLAAAGSLVAGLLLLAALPLVSSGSGGGVTVGDVLETGRGTVGGVTETVRRTTGALGATRDGRTPGGVQERATSPTPRTQPPLHGTNPHGQGTVAAVDLGPSAERPQGGSPDGSDSGEEVVLGRSRGEQRPDGSYHGHITIAALFGNELLGVDSTPGQTNHGPLEGLQRVLDQLCTGSSVCLSALTADSSTTQTGSTNRYSTAHATVGGGSGLDVGVAESTGDVSQSGDCQTAAGSSTLASVSAGGNTVAGVGRSTSTSTGCAGRAPQTQNSSSLIQLGQSGVPLPAPGCGNGTPDTTAGIDPLLPIVCNADDVGGQAPLPSGVREALSVFALSTGDTALAKVSASGAESLANPNGPGGAAGPRGAPDQGDAPGGETRGRDRGAPDEGGVAPDTAVGERERTAAGGPTQCSDGLDNDGDGRIDFPDDPDCTSRADDSEFPARALAFTGGDLVSVLIAGLLLLAAGIGVRRRLLRT